jgi:thiol-disulfide isomerase/thioredoxin
MSALPRLSAAALAVALLTAACGGAEDGSAGVIELGDGGFAPPVEAVQTEPTADNVIGLEYTTFDGGTARLDDVGGRPLVVNFFAQWCASCVAEMPEFEEVFQELDGTVEFIGISIDQEAADGLALVEQTGVTYPVGWDPSETLLAHFEGLAMPTTAFVRADGTIAETISAALDADLLRDMISEHLA